ncbi:hypothetical protein ACFLXQ_07045 [Chloroflexota bacterium]
MQDKSKDWIIQVIELLQKSLLDQNKSVPEKSITALVYSSISYALTQMVQDDLEAVQVFIDCLTPNAVDLEEEQVTPSSLAQELFVSLTEIVERQVEIFLAQRQEPQPEQITNIIQASKIGEGLIKPFAREIFAQGEAIVQAVDQSQANLVQLYFSVPHPLPAPHQQIDDIERLLEENPIEKIVDFEKNVKVFQRELQAQRSHIFMIEDELGSGKSSLLYRLMHTCVKTHSISYIDLKGGLLGVQEIADKIGKHTGLIEAGGKINDIHKTLNLLDRKQPEKKCVLFIDTVEDGIEKIPDFSRWLQEDLFDLIRPRKLKGGTMQRVRNLIIVVAGRQYVPRLYKSEWPDEYFGELKLRYWGESEIRQFARYLGMKELGDQFIKFVLLLTDKGKPITCHNALISCHGNPDLLTSLADEFGIVYEYD